VTSSIELQIFASTCVLSKAGCRRPFFQRFLAWLEFFEALGVICSLQYLSSTPTASKNSSHAKIMPMSNV
jgi:hypothetical protein